MNGKAPEISVVMSVKDDEAEVATSIESVLDQKDVDFELIIIDDGSRDNTNKVLREYEKKDRRIAIIGQDNRGLTKSLIRGCAKARGKYIARQDGGGDISLPGRLHEQHRHLENNGGAVLICSATRFVGPEGEHLYDAVVSQHDFDRGMKSLLSDEIKCPSHHGNTMFRRTVYNSVGGYRAAFRVAQDLDLWLRMYEAGPIVVDETVLYVGKVHPGDICFSQRSRQAATTKIILEAARLRRSSRSERMLLKEAAAQDRDAADRRAKKRSVSKKHEAEGLYHIAACLDGGNKRRARHYYRLALIKRPLYMRALVRWVATYLN